MKTHDEIKALAKEYAESLSKVYDHKQLLFQGFTNGYKACQDEDKFNESDMKAFAMACCVLSHSNNGSIEQIVDSCFSKNYQPLPKPPER